MLLALGLFEPFAAGGDAVGHDRRGRAASTGSTACSRTSNGIEVPLLYGVGAAALALTGPGAYSLDAVLGLTSLWTAGVVVARSGARRPRRIGNLARAEDRARRGHRVSALSRAIGEHGATCSPLRVGLSPSPEIGHLAHASSRTATSRTLVGKELPHLRPRAHPRIARFGGVVRRREQHRPSP